MYEEKSTWTMDQTDLISILEDKFNPRNQQSYRIFLGGSWGIGKTFVWRNFSDSVCTNLKLKPIYISLFGINTIELLSREVRIQYLQTFKPFSKHKTFFEKIFNAFDNVLKIVSQTYLGEALSVLSLVPVNLDRSHVICIGDLERKSPELMMTDILGFIERLGLRSNVLVIGNEEELTTDDKEKFQIFKEKVLDRQFYLDSILPETMNALVNRAQLQREYANTILDVFLKYGENNIRTLQKLTEFVVEFSEKAPLNATIVELCCILIIKHLKSNGDIVEAVKAKSTDESSLSRQYNLPLLCPHQVCIEVAQYLKFNKFNTSVISDYVSPPPDSECKLLLHNLQWSVLRDEKTIRQNIETVISKLESKDHGFFESHNTLLKLLDLVLYLATLLEFPIDVESVFSNAALTVSRIIDNTDKSRLKTTELPEVGQVISPKYYTEQFNILTRRIKEALTNAIVQRDVEQFNCYYNKLDYEMCIDITRVNPSVIVKCLHIFNPLSNPDIDLKYWTFILAIVGCTLSGDCNSVKTKLSELATISNDKMIKSRINDLIARRF